MRLSCRLIYVANSMSEIEKQQVVVEPQDTEVSSPLPETVQDSLVVEASAHADEQVIIEEIPAEPEAELPTQLPGEILAARREEMRLSIEEVSTRLKLAPRQIAALEENDFAQLPGLATLRGFIRSYAKLLELKPDPLIAMLANEPDPAIDTIVARRPLPSPGFNGRRYSPPTRHRSAARRLSGLAALIVIFVGTLAYLAGRNDWLKMPDIDLERARSALTSASTGAAESNATEPAKPLDASAPAVAAAPPSPESALQLKAGQDSWVEVIAVDGERKLVSRLMKAGSTELVEITEPVVLVVGNAAGVEAILRGQSLNLRAAARDNVAKLSLK